MVGKLSFRAKKIGSSPIPIPLLKIPVHRLNNFFGIVQVFTSVRYWFYVSVILFLPESNSHSGSDGVGRYHIIFVFCVAG